MKKYTLILMTLFSFSTMVNAQWGYVNSNTTNRLNAVFFQSNMVGYVVGAQGTIIKTIDAGVNWTTLNSGVVVDLKGVWFTNDTTGYATGAGGLILKTTDAGASWTPRNSGSASEISCIQFVNSDTGIIVGWGIRKTEDSAFTWTATNIVSDYYTSLDFVNDSVGYALEIFGKIMRTTDRGDSWTNVSPIMGGDPLYHIFFPSDSIGYVVGRFGFMMKTTDSGNTWVSSSIPSPDDINAVYFLNDSVGYAVGIKSFVSAIFKTTNGGVSWTSETASVTVNLWDVCFTPNHTGFAIGNDGVILKKNGSGVDISEKENPIPDIYPNPAVDKLTIRMGVTDMNESIISIYNLFGEKVKEEVIHQNP